ncbi:MAG: hypothetical protein K9M19_08390, partial [Candidatus Marinimicrobia bacterium]|nr:hypothetical protein [Candidatus Neomarinimicrobiota bacterium]
LPVDGLVELQVYDITGKLVKTLVSGEQTAGAHVVTWMGDNDRGQMTASGVYHLALTATETETEKQHRLHQKALLLK